MKTESLRTVAFACGVALLATAGPGCASRPKGARDVAFRTAMDRGLGFSGRLLVVDLGQRGRVSLRADGVRLDGGFLFLEEEDHRFDALGRGDLHMAWTYDGFRGSLKSPPTLSATSFLGITSAELHEVNLEYGHQQGGTVHFNMGPSAPFVATVGTAFVPCWGGSRGEKTLRTLNLVTGLEGWGWRTPGDIRGGLAIAGVPPLQSLYFATDGGEVYGLPASEAAAAAPEARWVMRTHGPVTADLEVSGDDLFVSSQDGFLYCLDRVTGGVRWSAPHEEPLQTGAVATAASVYQARSDGLWCHDRATGKVRWKLSGGHRLVCEREGKAVVVMGKGEGLAAVDAAGKVTGALGSGGYVYPTNTADDAIYAVSRDGLVLKLEVGGE